MTRIFAADATLTAWDSRRRRETALTVAIRRLLPRALADRVHVADARGLELVLACEGGSIGTVVRQRTPELLAVLRNGGEEFTGIRVRVQVRVDPMPIPKASKNQPDRESLRPLAGLARELPSGPLKEALERLLRRLG